MFAIASILSLAQTLPAPPAPTPQEIVIPQQVRPLPGQLDTIPTFNSNSPELVQTEGILLSTFPPAGTAQPAAHLNFPFNGRFDVFAHHVFRAIDAENTSLYVGVILYNPSTQPVTVDVLQAASYLSQPDAPFVQLPPAVEDPLGQVFAGPGSRVMSDILRGRRQDQFPAQIILPPGSHQMLMNLPIPTAGLDPALNGRSTLIRLRSSGIVYAASLALLGRRAADGSEQAPTLEDWIALLQTGGLAGARDRAPTPPGQAGQIIYGRVAGVAQGSRWQAQLTDQSGGDALQIPAPGTAYSYALSTLRGGRMGTNQVQAAPMLVRYPDTAYDANGNYGIEYNLTLPLYNATTQPQRVAIALQTPIKEDQLSQGGLRFFEEPPTSVFFRGTVRLRYLDDRNLPQTLDVHLVERRGEQGVPLVELDIAPNTRRLVSVDFLYPPDATPPQVLTVTTLGNP
ncbi:MAG: DUF3370 domain-containing protein [Microcoleus sp. SIO2G3]|nr:DUF3370 domain-containing protein [Microcoleus sp. SIO2G3]